MSDVAQPSDRPTVIFERVEVIRNDLIGDGVYQLDLRAPNVAAKIQGGQFVHMRLGGDETLLRRPLSVCQVSDDLLHILYAVVGKGTRLLTEKRVGDCSMDVLGPLGSWWPTETVRSALLVGGGLGIAPLGMLAHTFRDRGIAATIIQGAQSASRLLGLDIHTPFARDIRFATDDGSYGHHGLVTDLVRAAIESQRYDAAYVCGPEPMQKAVHEITQKAGLTTYVSLERRMACGIGACLGCTVPTARGLRRVCVDGPIFDSKEVCWDDAVQSRLHP